MLFEDENLTFKEIKISDMFENKNKEENTNLLSKIVLQYADYERNSPESINALEEITDLAKTNPQTFYSIIEYSGRYSGRAGLLYSDMFLGENTRECFASKRNFSENIYMMGAFAQYSNDNFIPSELIGKHEKITELPEDKQKILLNVLQKYIDKDDYFIKSLLERQDLITWNIDDDNLKAKIVRGIIGEDVLKLDDKIIINDKSGHLAKQLIDIYAHLEDFHSTKIMEAPNVDRDNLQNYLRARNLVLDWIKENSDQESLSQYFEKFVAQTNTNMKFVSLANDVYLQAIYQDINNGNANKLSEYANVLLVQNDKDGYYLRKINEKEPETAQKIANEYIFNTPEQYKYSYNPSNKQRDIARYVVTMKLNDYDPTSGIISANIPTEDKIKAAENAEVIISQRVKEQQKKFDLYSAYKADEQKVDNLLSSSSLLQKTMETVSKLQEAYKEIIEKCKNKRAEGKEISLSKENVEKLLELLPRKVQLKMPDEKAPLLFGGKEKIRLNELQKKIENFNKIISSEVSPNMDFSAYKNQILQESVLMIARKAVNEARKAYENACAEMNKKLVNEYKGISGFNDSSLNKEKENQERVQEILDRLRNRDNIKHKDKAYHSSNSASLQAVQPNMSDKEKRSVRDNNRKVIDPLVIKEEQKNSQR